MKQPAFALTAAAVLALAACSQAADEPTDAEIAAEESAAATTDDSAMTGTPGATPPAATGTPTPPASGTPSRAAKVLALEGLGDLVIGKPVPAGSSFKLRGAQASDTCLLYSSPDYPGVYAIVEKNQVRRISVGKGSDVKLVEGVGVGATEAKVKEWFGGFRATPHEYVDPPAKYLTQPGNDPRLRFEIGADGRVSLIHAGLMPQLGYVEGCA